MALLRLLMLPEGVQGLLQARLRMQAVRIPAVLPLQMIHWPLQALQLRLLDL
jgi:hypothetical protein